MSTAPLISQSRFDPTLPPEQRKLAEEVREKLWFGEDDPQRTHLEASRTMAAHAGLATGLKPFPAVAQNALSVLANPDSSIATVAEALERDPALTSKLLRVANSASYRGSKRCSSVAEAVVRLGHREVKQLVLAVATMGLFDDTSGLGLEWRNHLTTVAAVARVLGDEYSHTIASQAFLAGLVHDLGKLLSLQVREIPYESLSPKVHARPDELHVVERILVGYDHAVLGAHVLTQWRFPETVAQVVAWHHQPGRALAAGGDFSVLVAVVRVADALEYKMRHGDKVPDAPVLEELERDPSFEFLELGARTLHAKWLRFVDAAREMRTAMGR